MQLTFAKNLAAVDKKVRDEAFTEMKSELLMEKELSSLEYLKLWKALFYCYWLSDKTDVQLDLAEKISLFTLDLSSSMGINYIRYFWQTIIKEWHGIDKFRMDKYFSLLRHMHFVSFKLLEFNDWESNLLSSFAQLLTEGPLNPTSSSVPESLVVHFFEVYFPILEASTTSIPNNAWSYLLEPFFTFAAYTIRRHLLPSLFEAFNHQTIHQLKKCPEACQLISKHLEIQLLNKPLSKKKRNAVNTLLRSFISVE